MANQPDKLIKKLLLNINEKGQFTNKETNEASSVSCTVLSKLLYIIGHIAIRQMIHLDMSVYKELKRRDAVRKMRKSKKKESRDEFATPNIRSTNALVSSSARRNKNNSVCSTITEDNGEEALEGAIDDAEAEFVNNILENEIVTGNGLLAKFVYVFK